MLELSQILKYVHELELTARKNAFSLLSGDYTSTIPGRGLHFHEARKYVLGEPIRMIDWNMTARLGEPYVKVFREERERDIFIALDISPSMFTGWQEKTKLEYAIEMAATLAVSAIEARDRLGLILFNDQAVEVLRPASGKVQLFRILKAMLNFANAEPLACQESDIRAAIHAIQKFRGKRFIVFLLSDFIDQDVPDDLKYIQSMHDLSLFHIFDPFEYQSTQEVFLPAFSPEGSADPLMLHPGDAGSLFEIRNYLKQECLKYRLGFRSISVKQDIATVLREFFHSQKMRRG